MACCSQQLILLNRTGKFKVVLVRSNGSRAYQFALARVVFYLSQIGLYQLAGLFALDRIDSHF